MAFDFSELALVESALDDALVAREGVLHATLQKVADYLTAVSDFAVLHAGVMIEDLETLPKRLQDVLTGIAPLLLIVRVLSARDKATGVPGCLRLDPLTLEVRILENPKTNRGAGGSFITRNKAAEMVAVALKCRRVGSSFIAITAIEEADPGEGMRGDVLASAVTLTLSADVL